MNIVNKAFLRFRLRRFISVLRNIPLPYMAIILIMLAGAGRALFIFMETNNGNLIAGGGIIIILLTIHLRRSDYHFVCMVEERPYKVFAAEYAILSLPVSLTGAIQGFIPLSIATIIASALIGTVRQPVRRSRLITVPRLIPLEMFEIRSGFRRNGIVMTVFYAGAYAALPIPYLPLALLWFFLCVMIDFFTFGEPLNLLCRQELGTKRFLQRKLLVNLRFIAFALAPVCIIYGLVNREMFWLPAIFFILAILNVALILLSKYAFYQPKEKITGGQIVNLISIFGIFIPILAPLTLFLLGRNYMLAIRNLKPYLYVYN